MSITLLIFFAIAFALVFVLRLARIGTMLAFLLAGILAGPHGLGLFQLDSVWDWMGNLGIIFLWFTMGLELNMKRLWQLRKTIFGFGAAQVLMVAAFLLPILVGVTTWTLMAATMVALMLAMSSTAGDLGILADRNELSSQMGRQTFSILLFQDLLSVPLLAMLPIFAGKTLNLGANVLDVLAISAGLLIGAFVVGRYLLNPIMALVAKIKSKEAMVLMAMLNILLWAYLVTFIDLPPSMGAFVAGMLLSDTLYRHQIQADIEPYQALFLAMFFIALGMGLNLPIIGANWWIVAIGVIALIVIKFVALFIVARVRHVPRHESFMIALILAQGGEMALLILQTLKTGGINALPSGDTEILMAIVMISMMLTPVLLFIFDKLYAAGKLKFLAPMAARQTDEKNPDVIICGFGRVGRTIAEMLHVQNISYVAIDMDVDRVMLGRNDGFNVMYGDAARGAILTDFGLEPHKTRAVVVALDNDAAEARVVRAIKLVAPKIRIFARARNMADAKRLTDAGVKFAMPETIESSFMLGEKMLRDLGIKQNDIDVMMSRLRGNNYETLNSILEK